MKGKLPSRLRATHAENAYSVRTGQWVGDSFIYTNASNRLNYLVGDQVYTVSHFDQPMYLLGYLPRDGRIYIADKDVAVTSFALSLDVVTFQTLVLRGDLDQAYEMLPNIPDDQKNKIARFLEGQGYKEQALEVATDPEHRFDLALGLGQLAVAVELADVEHKWKTVGDAALAAWDLVLAEQCFSRANDLGSLLLLHSSTCNADGLRALAKQADAVSAHNIGFSCLWQLADVDGCIELLLRTGRTAEAVLFAQTFRPSRVPKVVGRWKKELEEQGKGKVARSLGMPPGVADGIPVDEDLFPDWEEWLRLEKEGEGTEEALIDVGGEENGTVNGAASKEDAAEEVGEQNVDENAVDKEIATGLENAETESGVQAVS